MESEEFMLLPANQLIDIISSDELNVRSEEQVFNAVMAWVKYSIQERRPQLPQVCIHLGIGLLFLLLGNNCCVKKVGKQHGTQIGFQVKTIQARDQRELCQLNCSLSLHLPIH